MESIARVVYVHCWMGIKSTSLDRETVGNTLLPYKPALPYTIGSRLCDNGNHDNDLEVNKRQYFYGSGAAVATYSRNFDENGSLST